MSLKWHHLLGNFLLNMLLVRWHSLQSSTCIVSLLSFLVIFYSHVLYPAPWHCQFVKPLMSLWKQFITRYWRTGFHCIWRLCDDDREIKDTMKTLRSLMLYALRWHNVTCDIISGQCYFPQIEIMRAALCGSLLTVLCLPHAISSAVVLQYKAMLVFFFFCIHCIWLLNY